MLKGKKRKREKKEDMLKIMKIASSNNEVENI